MKRIRQNTYVERELRRQKIERRQKIADDIKKCVAAVSLVLVFEAYMLALFLI